jgi:methionyl-tRNA synthetase
MPDASREMFKQLGLEGDPASIDPAGLEWGTLKEGTRTGEVTPIFPRLDKNKIMAEIDENKQTDHSGTHATEADAVSGSPITTETQPAPAQQRATEADAASPLKPEVEGVQFIEIGDFSKIDLRVGEILTAERVPKSDKLLRFTVDLGEPTPRQILAGIAEHYEPEKLIGRKVAIVANLKPRKLRGFESQGMVLAASVGEEGKPVLATFIEEVPNGARLK